MITAFPKGLAAHVRGIRFALANKGYLGLCAIPFALALLLYGVGFAVFAASGDQILAAMWTPDAAAGGMLGALAWLYLHIVKYILFALAFILMYFLFMITANVLAAPLYDHIAGRLLAQAGSLRDGPGLSVWRLVVEEAKKAVFVMALPLVLLVIPVLGQILAPLAAAFLLAMDFMDYPFSREEGRFGERLKALGRRPLLLLGFGLPLLIPFLNIVLFPFAIVSGTLLYLDMTGRRPTLPAK
ncbi:EI24 domain-containing protein [Desulfovibrio sp. TomC]|uniref:EI24 domain-containing protein n=1 Tax=Desulfovibrio sp. TomC TaxID=1562888 RepID=UPI00057328B1|nr:EI24 domain-containing protein [Desulfovibrio sp. TomC]KHK03501.1 Sulfate transporter, CysZ-type [Desulfovibrio sp. TomC]